MLPRMREPVTFTSSRASPSWACAGATNPAMAVVPSTAATAAATGVGLKTVYLRVTSKPPTIKRTEATNWRQLPWPSGDRVPCTPPVTHAASPREPCAVSKRKIADGGKTKTGRYSNSPRDPTRAVRARRSSPQDVITSKSMTSASMSMHGHPLTRPFPLKLPFHFCNSAEPQTASECIRWYLRNGTALQ
jgi:hypothetical protein